VPPLQKVVDLNNEVVVHGDADHVSEGYPCIFYRVVKISAVQKSAEKHYAVRRPKMLLYKSQIIPSAKLNDNRSKPERLLLVA
jgi:hypothetical protein